MSKKYLLLFLPALVLFLSACHPDNNTSPQVLIIGKWNLQQEHVSEVIDAVKKIDTVYNASANTHGYIVFNKDNTFSSASVYVPANFQLNLAGPAPNSANGKGTYGLSGNVFSTPPGLSGWFNYGVGSSSPPVEISYSVQITKITNLSLVLHTEHSFSVTYNSAIHTYQDINDFYYTK